MLRWGSPIAVYFAPQMDQYLGHVTHLYQSDISIYLDCAALKHLPHPVAVICCSGGLHTINIDLGSSPYFREFDRK